MINICTFPVPHIVMRDSVPGSYVATVRIERLTDVLADWHPPFFSKRWLSESEARRNALEYAVKLTDSGVPDEPRTLHDRAA
jgi:hypothetical protein